MLTGKELAIVLILGVLYVTWEMADDEPDDTKASRTMVERETQIRQGGSLSSGKILAAKELELINRGATLPHKTEPDNPANYEAKVDGLLDETSMLAQAYQPMGTARLQAYEVTSARTAPKVIMDMMLFNSRMEPLAAPNDYFDD